MEIWGKWAEYICIYIPASMLIHVNFGPKDYITPFIFPLSHISHVQPLLPLSTCLWCLNFKSFTWEFSFSGFLIFSLFFMLFSLSKPIVASKDLPKPIASVSCKEPRLVMNLLEVLEMLLEHCRKELGWIFKVTSSSQWLYLIYKYFFVL